MSVIKQLATYDGSAWTTDDIGANASNVSLTTSVAGQSNVQSALSKIVGTSALTANRAVITGTGGVLSTSTVTNTELSYLSGASSNIQTQINLLSSKAIWQYVDSGTHNLNDYTTEGKYYFSVNATLANAPSTSVNGWLEVLPSQKYFTSGGLEKEYIKQIWHRHGSGTIADITKLPTFLEEYVRILTDSSDTSSDWTSWKKFLMIDEDSKPFQYNTITGLSLSVTANGTSGLLIDSTHNTSVFNNQYVINGYIPFALFYISWSGGAGNVYLQTYKIYTDSFYVYIGNRASTAQSLTNFNIGLMYYRQGSMGL